MSIERYGAELRAAGFLAPKLDVYKDHFYKELTDLTAFAIHMREAEGGVEMIYGAVSTAFTRFKGDEESLIKYGVRVENINFRERAVLPDAAAEARIREMYAQTAALTKDELLDAAKAKCKGWIQKFAVRLKPLGFKKKQNTWTKMLTDEIYLRFDLQKSMYSDEYYFNIWLSSERIPVYEFYLYERLGEEFGYLLDWQLYPGEKADAFIDGELLPYLRAVEENYMKYVRRYEEKKARES